MAEPAKPVEIELRGTEADAMHGKPLGFLLGGSDMQQRLGRDAADIETHAAKRFATLDQGDLQTEVGGPEGSRVSPGPPPVPPVDRRLLRRRPAGLDGRNG